MPYTDERQRLALRFLAGRLTVCILWFSHLLFTRGSFKNRFPVMFWTVTFLNERLDCITTLSCQALTLSVRDSLDGCLNPLFLEKERPDTLVVGRDQPLATKFEKSEVVRSTRISKAFFLLWCDELSLPCIDLVRGTIASLCLFPSSG